jgi:CDP-diglyceride synthetase
MISKLSSADYWYFALTLWTVIALVWLLSLLPAMSAASRAKKLHRLAIWLALALLEAGMVWCASAMLWGLAFAVLVLAAMCEIAIATAQQRTMLATGAAMAGMFMLAYLSALPWDIFALPSFLLAATAMLALPYTAQPKIALILIMLCYFAPLLPLLLLAMNVQDAQFAHLNILLGLSLSLGHMADIASGFGGKLGKIRPLPRLSPNKTIIGFGSGLLGVALAAWCLPGSYPWLAVLALWGLTVYGDLVASKFKRLFSLKDFSTVLGPHGGIGDRLDSIAPCLCFALLWINLQ